MCVSTLRQQRSAKQRVENGFKSDKSTVAFVRSSQKSGCVSQDVELLEPTVGPANVRRSTLKKSGNISPRSHLELKYTKVAERFINIREQLGPSLGFSKADRNIIATPTRQRKRTEIQKKSGGQKMMREMQPGNGPNSCA